MDETDLTNKFYAALKETHGEHLVNVRVVLMNILKSQDLFIHDGAILPIIETDLRDIEDEFATWIVYTDPPEYEED